MNKIIYIFVSVFYNQFHFQMAKKESSKQKEVNVSREFIEAYHKAKQGTSKENNLEVKVGKTKYFVRQLG